jgi:hypothetical protein
MGNRQITSYCTIFTVGYRHLVKQRRHPGHPAGRSFSPLEEGEMTEWRIVFRYRTTSAINIEIHSVSPIAIIPLSTSP